MRCIRRDKIDVLPAAASAVQHVFPPEIFQGVRLDPLREQPLIVIVELVPLPFPLRVLLLHAESLHAQGNSLKLLYPQPTYALLCDSCLLCNVLSDGVTMQFLQLLLDRKIS